MCNLFAMVYLTVTYHDAPSLSKAFFTSFVKTENCQMVYKKSRVFQHLFLLLCFNAVCICFLSRIIPISFSLSSLTEIPFQGSSSEDDATDASVWVKIVVPLLTIIPISVVVISLLLFFCKRCKIVFLYVLRHFENRNDLIKAVI